MIRIVVKVMDVGDAANCDGAHAIIRYETIDITSAELEFALKETTYQHRAIIGGHIVREDDKP